MPTQTISVTSTNDQNASASITFQPPAMSFGWVQTTFTLDPANGQPGSFDTVESLPDITGIASPEPVSLSLMGFGLLALAGAKLIRHRH